ncbi:alpha/beta hydrolase [Staphylococcus equorum]|uniref:Alpha/beta hydrolase n=1 Tax=Staphylococcus equorum TaxID=246432 RepID=A0A9X4L7A3_9STAP|nr:alpha/beta hydrolase [Staphylococcus equorum]MDG0842447.1 alpha/beta hydrolase [Staphylococcus equorum]MDG0858421.1 alpha/beta hydrolase [Staphylococcus equorum]
MKNMFIVHGYQAHTHSHWFQWLANKMKASDYEVEVIYLPDSNHPDIDRWHTALHNSMTHKLNSETLIVAHSLGVVSVLNYLSQLSQCPYIKGLFLVSGFNETLENLPELDYYINQTDVQLDRINAQHIVTIGSDYDSVVDIKATDRLSNALGTQTIHVTHHGHFLASDGYETFELLREQITTILNQKNSEIGI